MSYKYTITIFTPTYNRENTLPVLFESLINQSCVDFEWLIVNDGSTDNTVELVGNFIKKARFPIRIVNTENGGKHRAINKGMKLAQGEWFAIVDSDDFLLSNAINEIGSNVKKINDKKIASLCFLRSFKDGQVVGDDLKNAGEIDSFVTYADTGIKGDKFQVFKTSALNEFSFPEFLKENFIAESALYLNFGTKYNTKFINKSLYVCEYLDGGLSDKSLSNRAKCPNGALYIYNLRFKLSKNIFIKFNGALNWWRFYFHGKLNGVDIVIDNPGGLARLFFLPGMILTVIDIVKLKIE